MGCKQSKANRWDLELNTKNYTANEQQPGRCQEHPCPLLLNQNVADARSINCPIIMVIGHVQSRKGWVLKLFRPLSFTTFPSPDAAATLIIGFLSRDDWPGDLISPLSKMSLFH